MTASTTQETQIRWMIRRDMPEVLDIERRCFEFFWTEADFLTALRQRNCIGMVAEHQGQIRGFMVYELLKDRLHLLNFAVDHWRQRSGLGTQMVDKLKSKLKQQRRTVVELEVRERNVAAQCFFREMGFVADGVLRGHYTDTSEDAYHMIYRDEWGAA